MKVYIAGDSELAALYVAELVKTAGHTIMSSWHDGVFQRTAEHMVVERRSIASRDLDEVQGSDILILIASRGLVPGGKFVEAGAALGVGKKVIVLGRRENILLWHPRVITATIETFLRVLEEEAI